MYKKYFLFFLVIIAVFACKPVKQLAKESKLESHLSAAERRQFDYYFYEGIRLKDNQKYDEALENFRLCLALDSLDGGALSEAGVLYASIGMNDEAVHCMQNSVKSDPGNWWYNVQLISMYSGLKNWQKAIDVTTELKKKYPNKEEVYTMLASFYKETKEYGKAIAAFDKLESISGIDQTISFEKFRLYSLSNKPKKGIAEIDKLINKYPTESRFKVFRGDIFMEQKMPDKAFEAYQQVLKDDPQNAFVYVSLSEYYNSVNQPDKAMAAIVSAVKSEQLDVDTKVQILGQYVEKLVRDSTKLVETESLFKLLVERYPLEEQVHGYYAVFLQYQKRNAEAISELETKININPKNDQTWLQLIQLYIGEKNYKQILASTNRAIVNLPKMPVWYFYKGIAEFQLEDYKAALSTYQTGLSFIPAEQAGMKSDFYAQIADSYYKLEKKDSAFANYEFALAANPKNIMVMNNYAYYLSLEKAELKKAEKMSAKTVELEPKNSTYLDTYAWILYQEGSYSLSKFYIERAVENLSKEEEHGVVLEHYGDILWMSNDKDKALEIWQKSLDAGNKTDELKKKIANKGLIL
jgi:tetratricopeptide (TPR) repeat protein